jgi:tetratricopeptide (TPR) repeat protein
MERQAAWATGNPQQADMLTAQCLAEAAHGHLKRSRELAQQAFDSARAHDLPSAAATAASLRATVEIWLGDPATAKYWAGQGLDLSHNDILWAAAPLALAGDILRAVRVVDEQNKLHPKYTYVQQDYIPQVESNDIGPTFYRGIAYLNMKSGKDAAAQFQKIRERRNAFPLFPLHSIGQLQLARSLAMAGDQAGARTAYQDLFALWKDADPDLPALKQAKDEYSRLH